jgi:hypothetical protein
MPAFSGLWDGVFHEPYTQITNPRPPISGLLRTALQRRGAYGYVRAFGGKAPATVKGVDRDRDDMQVRGGWLYATRADDPANRVDLNNIGNPVDVNVDITMPATVVDALALKRVRDIHLNRAYAKDEAATGVTATALPERYAV